MERDVEQQTMFHLLDPHQIVDPSSNDFGEISISSSFL